MKVASFDGFQLAFPKVIEIMDFQAREDHAGGGSDGISKMCGDGECEAVEKQSESNVYIRIWHLTESYSQRV